MSDRAVVGVYITGVNGKLVVSTDKMIFGATGQWLPIHTIGANLPYVMHTFASKRVLDLI